MSFAWRIIKKKHIETAFDGEGARLSGGRWNSEGKPAVYTSESLSLAALEAFVHMNGAPINIDFVFFKIEIPDDKIFTLNQSEFKLLHKPDAFRNYGNKWLNDKEYVALKVPSIIIPQENNIIINPIHEDFSLIKISSPELFIYDKRLLK